MAEGCQNYINEEYVEDILDTADFAIVSVHKDSPEWICCGGNCTSQFTEGVESDRPTLYRRYLVEGPVECWLQLWNNIDGLKALLENHHGGTHHIQATDSQFPSNRDVNFNNTTEAQLEPFQKD